MAKNILSINNKSTQEEIVACIIDVKARWPADPIVAAKLAQALAESGTQLQPIQQFSADVASTGGPSSLSTLLCPLYLRLAGATVPKLGVPGRPAGGIDCLIQIEGYRSTFSLPETEHLLNKFGYVHFLSGGTVAPLDSRMFELRQRHGAQGVPTLVSASLLSKKLAAGVRQAGLDVRVAPHGNFGKSWLDGLENARLFIEAARILSIEAFPVLTDARFPYQPYIGRREALLALHELFTGNASAWLKDHLTLCRNLAISCTPIDRRARILAGTPSDLQKQFHLNLAAQGASEAAFLKLTNATKVGHTHFLRASDDGFAYFNLEGIRRILVSLQATVTATGGMDFYGNPPAKPQ